MIESVSGRKSYAPSEIVVDQPVHPGFTIAGSTSAASNDERAVRELVDRYAAARQSQDVKAIEALFTADADQLVSSGEWRHGSKALVRGMLESSRSNSGVRTIIVETVRMLAPDVALADAATKLPPRPPAKHAGCGALFSVSNIAAAGESPRFATCCHPNEVAMNTIPDCRILENSSGIKLTRRDFLGAIGIAMVADSRPGTCC